MRRLLCASLLVACNDLTRYSNNGDHWEGQIVQGAYVRAGFGADVKMRLTFDGAHFQDSPGSISIEGGPFHASVLRPIPQVWHDPISLMSLGDSSVKSMIYAVAPRPEGADALAVVSLMKDNSIEVRLIRGAPPGPEQPCPTCIFGVFRLERKPGPGPTP